MKLLYIYILFIIAFTSSHQAISQTNKNQKRIYTTSKTSASPIIDGVIDEDSWDIVKWSSDFSKAGIVVSKGYDTKFKIIYDDKFIYIGIRCFDQQPDSIPIFPSPRDNPSNDWVEIDFNTNLDRKTGYALSVSPYGVRTDMIIEENENFNGDWHPKWDVKTRIDHLGWVAEIKIPFDQFEITNALDQEWGLQVVRRIIRYNEISNWQIPIGKTHYVSQFGILKGLRNLPKSKKKISHYNPNDKISIVHLKKDLNFLKTVLEGIHPSLYWFQSKTEMDSSFQAIEEKIETPLTHLAFYKLLTPIFSLIGDGHSSLRLPKKIRQYLKQNIKFLPLGVFIRNSKIYITDNWSGNNSIKRGDEIIAINGIKIDKILDKLRNLTTSDGYNITYKDDRIGSNFYNYLALHFGKLDHYEITLNMVNQKTINLHINALLKKDFHSNSITRKPSELRKNSRNFQVLDSTTAYLYIRSFNGGKSFRSYIDRVFKKIKEEKLKNLIIDLRYSYGGQDRNGVYLYSYLAQDSFKYFKQYETNTRLDKRFLTAIDCCISREDLDFLTVVSTKDKNGIQKLTNYELSGYDNPDHFYKPQENAFNGNVYVLINGANFSTSSDFSAIVKDTNRGTLIGEETGGGYFGNTSGITKSLKLPNTGLIARIALIKYLGYRKKTDTSLGRGVMPDYPIFYSNSDVLNELDKELKFALESISQKK